MQRLTTVALYRVSSSNSWASGLVITLPFTGAKHAEWGYNSCASVWCVFCTFKQTQGLLHNLGHYVSSLATWAPTSVSFVRNLPFFSPMMCFNWNGETGHPCRTAPVVSGENWIVRCVPLGGQMCASSMIAADSRTSPYTFSVKTTA